MKLDFQVCSKSNVWCCERNIHNFIVLGQFCKYVQVIDWQDSEESETLTLF